LSEITDILIHQCKKGNRAAQKELYYLSKDRLKQMALRYCRVTQDAQDAVQNAYLKIFRSIDQFNPEKGHFNAWSAKVLANEALMILRKTKKFDFIQQEEFSELSTDGINLDKLTINEVQKAMTHLNDDYRLVINMHFFEEFTYKEMSTILKLKESSVRSKVTRAKRELKSIWSNINRINYEY